jgi:hypothetical protein
VAGTTTTNAAGQFSFVGLNAGNYVVEVVNATGTVIATSTPTAVAAGSVATVGVSVAGAVVAGTAATAAPFFGSTLGIAAVAAAGAAVGGVTVAASRPQASGSQ